IKESELGRKALILGETNTDAVPIEDVTNMDKALRTMKFGSKSFDRVVSYPDHTKKDVVNKINSEFSNSKDSDVNYLYFTCHGVKEDSALAIGSDNQCMTGEELRDILIDKKGVFVVMIDSCHAGNFINKGTENNLNQFIKGLTTSKEKAGELCNKKFIVLASSSSSESSYKKKFMKNSLATHFWLKGIGYDGETNSVDEMEADVNIDSKVTLNELYNYSTKEVLKLNNIQHVQKYSEFEDFVLFARY
ncbi:caspase family protein, partial [Gemelliphila asaccharolytica]